MLHPKIQDAFNRQLDNFFLYSFQLLLHLLFRTVEFETVMNCKPHLFSLLNKGGLLVGAWVEEIVLCSKRCLQG